jgi:hypothetical protein
MVHNTCIRKLGGTSAAIVLFLNNSYIYNEKFKIYGCFVEADLSYVFSTSEYRTKTNISDLFQTS